MKTHPTRMALLTALKNHFQGLPEFCDISEQQLNQSIQEAIPGDECTSCVGLTHQLAFCQLIHWRLAVSTGGAPWNGSESLPEYLRRAGATFADVQAWYVEDMDQCMDATVVAHAVWVKAGGVIAA